VRDEAEYGPKVQKRRNMPGGKEREFTPGMIGVKKRTGESETTDQARARGGSSTSEEEIGPKKETRLVSSQNYHTRNTTLRAGPGK